MRARNREINIFNMSLLDILTGMLGAFLFLMIGLVPYYAKVLNSELITAEEREKFDKLKDLLDKGLKGPLTPEEVEQLKTEMARLEGKNAQLESELNQTKEQLQATTEERDEWKNRVRTDLIVTVRWDSPAADVDIFLRASDGAIFGPKKEKLLGTDIKGTTSESHTAGRLPSNYEALNIGVWRGQEFLVLFRVTIGKSQADYSNMSGFAVVDDSVGNSWVSLTLPGIDSSKAVPGKVYAWAKVGYDEKGSLSSQLPTGKLPEGVTLP